MITIRKFRAKDTEGAARLVSRVFSEFNNKEGSKKAIQNYINFYNSDKNIKKIQENFAKSPVFFVAIKKRNTIGMIRGTVSRIFNLFVDGSYQKKGIGKSLLKKFENECKKSGSIAVKIRSSIYAVPFYKKMGYKKSTGVRNFRNLTIQPMKKNLIDKLKY